MPNACQARHGISNNLQHCEVFTAVGTLLGVECSMRNALNIFFLLYLAYCYTSNQKFTFSTSILTTCSSTARSFSRPSHTNLSCPKVFTNVSFCIYQEFFDA
jgi:hypothetical protein